MLGQVPELALLVFFVGALSAALWLGSRLGLRRASREEERTLEPLTTLEAAVLGLLALLLGFSFQMAMARWDLRKHATIDEANAIGTTYLRSSLLPEPQRTAIRAQLVDYVDARLSRDVMSPSAEARTSSATQAQVIQARIWELAVAAAFADPRPTTSGLFVQSLNAMIDANGTRVALIEDHVPESILWLLLGIAIASMGLAGYTSGVARRGRLVAGLLVVLLVSSVIALVVDLDRPSLGLIRVSDANLRALRATMHDAR
jgi:hypothetical protein